MTEWAILVRELGFPIAVTLIVILIGVKAGKWTANSIIVPLKDAHISFLNSIQDTQTSQASTLNRLAAIQEESAEETKWIRRLLERHSTAEVQRGVSEDIRVHSEDIRNESELLRSSAEILRGKNEDTRNKGVR